MYSRVVRVTKEIVKKGISVGICLAMLLPILPLNFSFIMNTEKEAKAGLATAPDHCTSKANANSWAYSDLRAWLNNALATSVPDSGTAAPTGKNYKLDSTATSDNTSGYAKSAFPDNESWSELAPITRFISDGKGSYHKLTDKVVIPHRGGSDSNMILKIQPEGIDKGTYSVPWKDTSYSDKHMTCTPSSSDATKISGFNGFGEAQDIAVSDNGYVNPIIDLSDMSQIVCAPTLAELQSNGGTITKNLTKDSASSSARMCFYRNEDGLGYFANISIDENGRVGFGLGMRYKTCVAMAMKKNGNNIEIITSSSNVFDEGIRGYWIDFGKTKEELKEYVFYAWQEAGGDKYASAGYMTGAYWNGDSLKADPGKGSASALDGFKGIVYGNTMVGYQGTVPFGNRTWRYLGNDYFVQEQPENVIFNASTDGYGVGPTGINLSDELRNGIELTTTGSPVEIPTDGISLTGFPANAPISFQYYYADIWRDGTPKAAGSYYVIVCVWSEGFEPKYSPAFPLTVEEIPVPKYTAPTKKIDAIWRDKAKDKLPSALADHFGYPKTASGANIPGTWALVDENAEVGNVDGSNRPIGKFTPDPSVLDTYNWAGLSGWNATEGRLEVPALFTVAPMPADRLGCAQLSNWGRKYDGRPKSWVIKVKYNGAYISNENYDVVWPEDMTNAGTKTYTVNLKNNCTGTLTGTVAILKREIKITADNQNICYGDQLPQLTWKQSGEGFVGSGSLIEGTVAVEESGNYPGPGNYNIIPSGFSTNEPTNYEVSHVNGTLAVGTDTFEITPRDISNVTKTVTPPSGAYTGGVHTPDVVLTDILNSVTKTLTLNTDYTIAWPSDMTNVGQKQGTITGKGNYQGTTDIAYEITPRQITITPESKSQVYGAAEVPLGYTVKDTNTGETLNIKSELTGSLATAQTGENGMRWPNADKYTIGLGTLTSENNPNYLITLGAPAAKYTITKKDVTSDSNVTVRVTSPTLPYTGQAPELELEVKDGDEILVRGIDYIVEADGIEPGTYTFTIRFIKNRTGTKEGTYTIQPKPADGLSVELDETTFTYNGKEQTPEITVIAEDGAALTLGTDYTVSYEGDRINVGTVTVTITLKGNYSGTITKTYRITQRDITSDSDFVVTVSPTSSVYTGVAHTPTLTAKYKNVPLTEGSNRDFIKNVAGNMTDQGEHTYTVTGQGNFKGSKTVKYTITRKAVSDSTPESELDIKLSETEPVYSKEEKRPTVTAKTILNGKTINLSQGTDFTVSYKDIDNGSDLTNVGRKKAIITFINNLSGTVTKEYTIVARDITSDNDFVVTVSPTSSGYTGVAHTPTLTAKYKNAALTEGSNRDFTKIITGNMTDQGEHTYTVTGQGNFKGSKTVKYTITQRSVSDSTPESELDIKLSETEPVYSKEEKRPTVTAKTILNGKTINLSQGTDFTVSYKDIDNGSDLTNVGRKKAIITFINNLSGTVTREYTIVARDITSDNDFVVTVSPTSSVYTRSKHTPTITVKYKNAPVATDDWSHSSSEDMISAKLNILTIAGKRNFTGRKTVNYTITPKPITVTAVNKTKTYGDADPELTIDVPGLVAGDTLSGSLERVQGEDANTYEIRQKIAFANPNYTITFKPGTFTIKPRVVSDGVPNGITMTLNPGTTEFNGERQLPKETLNDTNTGKKLIKGQDYDLEYLTNMTDAMVHTVKAKLKNNYSGEKTATFTITPKQISDNTPESELKVDVDKTGYTDETGYTYDKTPKKPAVTIKAMFGNRTMSLTQGTHFDVNYLAENGTSDVTNVGPKKMVITFKKDFSGGKTIKYAINRRDVTIRANERRRYYKTPDPDMRPRTNYDTINGLIAGDNLYGSFEREDPTNEEVGRYKIIQGRTLTNANNPNYNIIFDAENSGYFIIEVDKSSWGTPQDDPKDHYVDDEGKTSVEVDKYGMVWLKETSDGTSAWYGIDNSKGVFRIGSRFWVMWLSEKESPETYKKYWDMLDEDHKRAMESINGWIFLIGVTDPDGEDYKKFSEDENGETDEEKIVPTYVQIGDDWDEDELVGVFISETEDEDIVTTFVNDFEFPEGLDTFGKMMLRHFSPYFIYDRDTERKALEGNDDEANVLRTTVDIKGKTVQIIVSGPRKVLPTGTKLIAVEDRNDNTCKIWLVDQSGKELPSPLSERVEVFIEMVDGMEDLIEVRLPKIGEDFHYGKFDGSWYGAIYTPYFPISLSLDELTDAERDELNKKRGLSGDKESGSDGGSSSSRNGSNAENDGQGDNETEELQPAENGSSNWWQNLSRTQIICLTAAGILLLLLLIFLILLILKRRKEKENSSQQ